MTRNCLNVMRKVAADLQPAQNAGMGAAAGLIAGNAVYPYPPMQATRDSHGIESYPVGPNQGAYINPVTGRLATYRTDHTQDPVDYKPGRQAAVKMGARTVPYTVQERMSKAPSNDELYQAQKQVDARRAQSGLPRVDNMYNRPGSGLLYDPKMRDRLYSALLSPLAGATIRQARARFPR